MTELPKTSHLKSIDVWFIFSIGFLTAIILVHLATSDSFNEVKKFPKSSCLKNAKVLNIAKGALGLLYISVSLCYWLIVGLHY